jgi:hypothetical protein
MCLFFDQYTGSIMDLLDGQMLVLDIEVCRSWSFMA